MFDQLFRAAMKQTHVRVRALDNFAVHFKHQTQHAVRRGVLRAKIQRQVLDFSGRHQRSPFAPIVGLFIAGQHIVGALPGAHKIETAERLC